MQGSQRHSRGLARVITGSRCQGTASGFSHNRVFSIMKGCLRMASQVQTGHAGGQAHTLMLERRAWAFCEERLITCTAQREDTTLSVRRIYRSRYTASCARAAGSGAQRISTRQLPLALAALMFLLRRWRLPIPLWLAQACVSAWVAAMS